MKITLLAVLFATLAGCATTPTAGASKILVFRDTDELVKSGCKFIGKADTTGKTFYGGATVGVRLAAILNNAEKMGANAVASRYSRRSPELKVDESFDDASAFSCPTEKIAVLKASAEMNDL